jgi:hypothetical protein
MVSSKNTKEFFSMQKPAVFIVCLAVAFTGCKKNAPATSSVEAKTTPAKPYQPKDASKPELFPARVKGKFGFIDKTGKMMIAPTYLRALDFSEGLAPVQEAGSEKWGFVDVNGKMVIPATYNLALPFSEGLATVRAGDKFGCINKAGELVVPAKFAGITPFTDGLATAILEQTVAGMMVRGWGFIKIDGTFAVPPLYDAAGVFREGLAPVKIFGKKWGFIDVDRKIRIEPVFEGANQFAEGLASVEGDFAANYKWGFIDHDGKYVISPRYTLARTFSEGLVGVQVDNENWGFADKTGKIVINAVFKDVAQFHNGVAAVQVGTRQRYIDTKGKTIWEEKP